MKKTIIACAVAFALSACGASGTSPLQPTNPTNIPGNILQFKVGTANLYGAAIALNVVATYRQPAGGFHPGDSGTLVNSPTLALPAALAGPAGTASVPFDPLSTVFLGPSQAEITGNTIQSTSQAVGAHNVTSFGQSGGVFGIGIEPYNYIGSYDDQGNPTNINTPFSVAPYPVPLYNVAGNPYTFEPWGGPPAFDLAGNGQSVVGSPTEPGGTAGIGEGIDIFGVAPTKGAYSLTVGVAGSSGFTTKTASASLHNNPFKLPTAATPTFTGDGSGGGTIGVTMPGGTEEAYVQVTDFGPPLHTGGCNGATFPATPASKSAFSGSPVQIYYTMLTKSSGSVNLPDHAGPNGSESICAGDVFTVQLIAFDYPAYEASYPASYGNPHPSLQGLHGDTDNITISPMLCAQATAGGAPTLCSAIPVSGNGPITLPIGNGGQPAVRHGGPPVFTRIHR